MNPLSGVLGEAWGLYKAHAAHLLAIAFVVYLIAAVIVALLALAGGLGSLLGEIVDILAGFLVQAALVKAVQDVRDGRTDLSLGETISAGAVYIGRVAGASILAAIAIGIGLLLLLVPGFYLLTIWAVIVPVIVIGGSGAMESFGRSFQLVRGNGWHVFATLVLVFLLLILVSAVIALILYALPAVARSGISSVVSGTLIGPYLALVVTLIYYRLIGVHGPADGSAGGYRAA